MPPTVDVRALHAALDAARDRRGWSWRYLARELELSPSTMSRLANGLKPDLDAFAAMVAWLDVDADKFIVTNEKGGRRDGTKRADLMTDFAMLLRARGDLDERDAAYLQDVMRAAVRRFDVERSTQGE